VKYTDLDGAEFESAAASEEFYSIEVDLGNAWLNKAAARELRAELDDFLTETFEVGDKVEMLCNFQQLIVGQRGVVVEGDTDQLFVDFEYQPGQAYGRWVLLPSMITQVDK
jgi:hypothetical protein